MRDIPRVALVSASAAPVVLIGGWTLAQSRQPPTFDPVRDTISALAAIGATDRFIMTSALAGLGVCHLVTALGLRPASAGERVVFATGGVATMLVAAFAQPERGSSGAHTAAATVAFVALGAWPLFSRRRENTAPLLRRPARIGAASVMLGLVAWFALELHGEYRGLAERLAAGAEALWPLAVVITTRRALAKARAEA